MRIEDYALIGDSETAALVGRNGSIDWLCLPRFDSGACFAALLGTPQHGRWRLAPAGEIRRTSRRYRPETLILETEYETGSGAVTVTDWMPPRRISDTVDVIRMVSGVRGQVRMQMELLIRFDYGWIVPWVQQSEHGLRVAAGPNAIYLRTAVPLEQKDQRIIANFTVSEGQEHALTLAWAPAFGAAPPVVDAVDSLEHTQRWWEEWAGRCTYEGEWREAVVRSLITLKALTYAPTGGLVAAPTTSLPENLGGERNWDYRYCWLRDATFTLYALMVGGYVDEAAAWREWLVNAVAGNPEEIQIMYGVAGERRLPELVLDWLPGYAHSTPVRVGNAAYQQHQLDVFGEVMDALELARRTHLEPAHDVWQVQRAMLDFLESDWQEPDNGIWEMRGPKRHFTHSKVMAWVGMDRAVRAVERFGLDGPVDRWRALRQTIHDEVCEKGYDAELNTFVQYYGSQRADAALLMLPLVGFLPADEPRMKGTVAFIRERLAADGLVHRYEAERVEDGLSGGEGAFLLCTFWLVDNLALQGRTGEARELFKRLLTLRNDVGLLAEQYDTRAERFLGNFPQAFSHVGLVNSARNLCRAGGPAEDRQQQQ